jgi:hypothetical protein
VPQTEDHPIQLAVPGVQVSEPPLRRETLRDELDRAKSTFHALVSQSSRADLQRRSAGTRWSNQQLLFHMMFGYMIVRTLLPLVRMFTRLPDPFSRTFARVLNAGTRPFHAVNYLGSCGGAMVFRNGAMSRQFDRTITALERHLANEADVMLDSRMHFPVGWDPYFTDTMSLLEVYHYGTQHFDHHARQLTLQTPEL